MKIKQFFKIVGPGLLYAGAAVGVSHLVQSTRAGASYGFDLLWILIIANIIKYPFFEFGPRYAASTGKSLIDGYNQLGKWATWMFLILTITTMFTIQAAVTIVTAGLLGNIFGLSLNSIELSALILLISMLVLMVGRFTILDRLMKLVIIVLAISTLIAVIFALGKYDFQQISASPSFSWLNKMDIFFLIAFIGWMPAPIDVTVWQSLWTNEKFKNLNFKPKLKHALLDFKVGYIGTAILAIFFLTLGALVISGSGEELSPDGVNFAGQLINLYTTNIGSWSYPIIAIAAITTMFSTTITCLDAYPRVMSPLIKTIFYANSPGNFYAGKSWMWIVIVAGGAIIMLKYLSNSMRTMVDIATTLSFITAPILAFMNYKVVTDKHMPIESRPSLWLKVYAWIGIVFLSGFTIFYVIWKFLL
ncbi:MAG: Nramp family divalent metal transporter [Bacteroidales bacterium]|nr:Nramp family divalent metal transporter [Bacteroidales bacterium]MCF8404273.1 Nramp family divalent metal transporter [Bacteroidales bacterium]